MARVIEKKDPNGYEMRIRKHKQHVIAVTCGILAAVVIICVFMVNAYVNRTFSSYQISKSIKREDTAGANYMSYGEYILKYSQDGASAIGKDGKTLWNGSYEMRNPKAAVCGDYVAIADIGGKEIYVFNGKDSGTKVKTTKNIIQIDVAKQGVIAVLTEDKLANQVQIIDPYTSVDQVLVDSQTGVQKNGFPVDIALSNDGTKLVTSYMSVNNGVIKNKLTFYNFGDTSKKEQKIVGMKDFDSSIIAKVDFVNNDTVCAFSDNSVTFFDMKEVNKEIKTKKFENPIKSIFYNSDYVGVVTEDYSKSSKYLVEVYNTDGSEELSKKINYDYEQVDISGKEIIFSTGVECRILKVNGVEKFHYTFDKTIYRVFPINNYNYYFLVTDNNIEVIKLTEE
ncbi:hypothetical protein lbkm_3416 [Lachnospiraceae bacterium KM106-2]|nr:hypothetical protein lbkm_3416 [Lachnospiraceae bacterium KM106-2]